MAYSPLRAQAQPCSQIISTSADSIAFLQEQKERRQSPCITSVIKQLGQNRDVNAIPVLVSYLDFVDPSSDVRPVYPSIEALFQIAEPAVNDLMSAIQDSESSIIRQNAAKTYMFVYRDDLASGIRQLKREESIAKSADALRRLSKARKMLVDTCNGLNQQKSCKDADQED
jgi:hypothetical protein